MYYNNGITYDTGRTITRGSCASSLFCALRYQLLTLPQYGCNYYKINSFTRGIETLKNQRDNSSLRYLQNYQNLTPEKKKNFSYLMFYNNNNTVFIIPSP